MTEPKKKPWKNPRINMGLAAAALAIAIGVWVSNGGTSLADTCAARPEAAEAIDAVAQGELAALQATAQGRSFEDLGFQDAAGAPVDLADFSGQKLLVNFWATWCVPCREEMPDLNAIAGDFAGADFELVTVSLDAGEEGPQKAQAFFDEFDLDNLALYTDPTLSSLERLREEAVALGLPATLLLDENGCEMAVLQGPAAWSSDDGRAVVETLIGLDAPAG